MNDPFGGKGTFFLCLASMVIAAWGVYLNLWPPDVFQNVLTVALPSYAGVSIARKVSAASIEKSKAAQPENGGVVK